MEQNLIELSDFTENKTSELYITFNLLEKVYAIQAEKIIEIVQLPALTLLEKAPEYIVGLLNLRGTVVSVIDLSMILGFHRKVYSVECQVLILNVNNKKIGIIIDSVKDVMQFEKKLLEPLPYASKEHTITGVYKDDNGLIAFLDLDKVINNIENLEISEERKASVYENDDFLQKVYSGEIKNDIASKFAVDKLSVEKFAKRALKLQKELRNETDSLNYQEDYFISFSLNGEIYCINLKFVKEITKLKHVSLTKVPCVPDFIIGLINLRGDFITIVDIKKFLNIPKADITEKTKIIVIRTENMQIGILVDDIFGIENIPNEKLSHNMHGKYEKNNFTSAEIIFNDKIMSVFDLKKFLEDERLFIEDAV